MAKSRASRSTTSHPRKSAKSATLMVKLWPGDGTHTARCYPEDIVRVLSVVDGFDAHGLPRDKIDAAHKKAQAILIGTASALNSLDREEGKVPEPGLPPRVTVRDEWDEIGLELAGLKPLLRLIERHIESVPYTQWIGELTAGDLSSLAGLAHRRIAALDERMNDRRPANDRAGWDT